MSRGLPLIALTLFVGVGFVWRSWYQVRRFGSSGIVLFQSGRWAQHLREAALLVMVLAIGGQAVAAAVASPTLAASLLWPVGAAGQVCAIALVLAGTGVMVLAQLQMGASWRVGIDEGARPGLVRSGLYRLSRNPIYVAMLLALLGFVLLLPTWLSLLTLLATVVGIRRQVLEEEAYLLRTYGDDFADYAAHVGRFVPGVGLVDG
ncbi:MAG: methyltransferase family protein [Candidatus Binatia bacterium]